jgi:pyrophosphatase PpaX
MTDPAGRTSAVLFDLDGTLIDSIELIRESYRHTLLAHTGSSPADAFWLAGLGRPLAWQFEQFTRDPAEVERMIATYRAYNLARHDELVRRYPGALEAVQSMAQRGIRLGVVTSKLRSGALKGLRLCGFEGLFEVVLGADDVARPKPDPEPVLRALELLELPAAEVVFVGDSPHDLDCGRAAGVRTAAALWGPFPRDWLERSKSDRWLATPGEIATLA